MSADDGAGTGIPTRAIHESYLSLQRAHRDWRRARDFEGGDERQERIAFQDQVLTFYELLRPHLQHESGLSDYWHGAVPGYPDEPIGSVDAAVSYYRQQGTAIWQIQRQPGAGPIPDGNQQTLTDGGLPQSLRRWDELLDRPDKTRLLAVQPEPEAGTAIYLEAIPTMGLKRLDHWGTREITRTEQQDGFLAGTNVERTVREPMPAEWVVDAKRLLVEAADRLGALSDFEVADNRDAEFDYSDLLGESDASE